MRHGKGGTCLAFIEGRKPTAAGSAASGPKVSRKSSSVSAAVAASTSAVVASTKSSSDSVGLRSASRRNFLVFTTVDSLTHTSHAPKRAALFHLKCEGVHQSKRRHMRTKTLSYVGGKI